MKSARRGRKFSKRSTARYRKLRRKRLLHLEPLEDRRVLATVTVNTISDVNDGDTSSIAALNLMPGPDEVISLREAIIAANMTGNIGGPDEIFFNIPDAGPHTIQPFSALPTVTDPVIIDGTTQPGAECGSDGVHTLRVEINGANIGAPASGLVITAGGSTVRGLVINRFGSDGIDLLELGGNTIECNYIGTDVLGTTDLGNVEDGIYVDNSTNNLIGGPTLASRNVVSGNGEDGIGFWNGSTGNQVLGNLIGTDVSGTIAIGNGEDGVFVFNSADNTIGGTTAAARNIISANGLAGIGISGQAATSNLVEGNYIGTDVNGTSPLGNGGVGVGIEDAKGNTVGGAAADGGNVIAANFGPGVGILQTDPLTPASDNVVQHNLIGLGSDGQTTMANLLGVGIAQASGNFIGSVNAGNVISGNEELGVGITGAGATNNIVEGNRIGTDADGLSPRPNEDGGVGIQDAASNTVRDNLIAGNTGPGVLIGTVDPLAPAAGNIVEANQIGVDVTGNSGLGNLTGVLIGNADDNLVGSADTARGNLISGNDLVGVSILNVADFTATGNDVQGNLIGLDAGGTNSIPNGPGDAATIAADFNQAIMNVFGFDPGVTADEIEAIRGGVSVWRASGNTVGGTAAGAGNVISGNLGAGVALVEADNNAVQGNFIGTDASGAAALGNTNDGVIIQDGASGNTIGGTVNGAGNVISGNGDSGVNIFGETAAGNTVQGNLIGTNSAGTLALANESNGVTVASPDNTIGGTMSSGGNVISGNESNGVAFNGELATGNVVTGNFIGTTATGTAALGNSSNGLSINSATNNTIGGTTDISGNVVSGNGSVGIAVNGNSSTGNIITGNYVGTDVNGTSAIPNSSNGISLNSAPGNTVGGTAVGAGNVISGNNSRGLAINGAEAINNVVQGNFIGTDETGTIDLGNANDGIDISAGFSNLIGGTEVSARNVVAFNDVVGITVRGSANVNSLLGNSVFGNSELGIDLGDDGVTSNDAGDPDIGANNFQNFPVLTSAVVNGSTAVTGTLNSLANTNFRIEFFGNTSLDPTGFGEGAEFLGSVNVLTNGSGDATINAVLPVVAVGRFVTSTATRLDGGLAPLETSEFSGGAQVQADDNGCSLVVNNTNDGGVGSLREAILCANLMPGPDTIVLPAGTYMLDITGPGEDGGETGDLDILDDLTIVGAESGTTIIDASGLDADGTGSGFGDRIFHVHSVTVEITGVTITGGNVDGDGGAILSQSSDLTIRDSVVDGNSASGTGGGIATEVLGPEDCTLTVEDTTISNNTASGDGGGIFNLLDTVNITRSTINGNTAANNGGGLHNGGGPATLVNSTFSGNEAAEQGGGILVANGGQLLSTNSTIVQNRAHSNVDFDSQDRNMGGGIYRRFGGRAEIHNTIVARNLRGPSGSDGDDDLGGDAAGPTILVADAGKNNGEPARVLAVNPETGDRATFSDENTGIGPDFERDGPRGIGLNLQGDIFVTDSEFNAVFVVDSYSSDRTILSDNDTPALSPFFGSDDPRDVTVDANGDIFVTARDSSEAIFEIDPANGTRTIVSDTNVGTGDDFQEPAGLTNDVMGNLLVADRDSDDDGLVVQVDPITGNRTTISDPLGDRPDGILIVNGAILVSVRNSGAILAVDPSTGAVSTFSDDGTGTGPDFGSPRGMSLDDAGNVLVTDKDLRALFVVDSATGNRTILSDSANGTGPDFERPRGVLFVSFLAGVLDPNSSFNIIGVDGVSGLEDGVNGNQVGTAETPIEPLLGALADNGGPTETHTLLMLSPAIDRADAVAAPPTDQRGVARPQGVASDIGAVEVAAEVEQFDFGDAPDSYGTLLASDGARHAIIAGGPFLGTTPPDAEADGQPNADATGDDTLDGNDDENVDGAGGVVVTPGQQLTGIEFDHNGGATGALLNAWVDLNIDGDWNDAGEQILTNVSVSPGPSTTLLDDITIPADVPLGMTFIRVRIGTEEGLTPSGEATNGEVEDFSVQIVADCSLVVINTNDAGAGSLRDAIICANDTPGLDTVSFAIPGGGPHTIQPLSALPDITDAVIIDGFTQPGAAANTNPLDQPINAVMQIEIDGSLAGAGADGLAISAGGSTVRGLVINRFAGDGIELNGGAGHTIAGNFVGTNVTGTSAAGNGGTGVVVLDSTGNTIGGLMAADRNLVSGNEGSSAESERDGDGIALLGSGTSGNVVQGNYVGVNAAGTGAIPNNDDGVDINSSSNNLVGGTATGAGNLISGNDDDGVEVDGGIDIPGEALNNVVQGNLIGTDRTGTAGVGNSSDGVVVQGGVNTTVGGTTTSARNIISGNESDGVDLEDGAAGNVVQGNFIGTDITGSLPLGNGDNGVEIDSPDNLIGGTEPGAGNVIAFNGVEDSDGAGVEVQDGTNNPILANSIHSNSNLGINLIDDGDPANGVTPNDPGDLDTGPNNLQNFPVLTSASSDGGSTTIGGLLDTQPGDYRVEFFANASLDPSGNGEGETFLGDTLLSVNGDGSFLATLPVGVSIDQLITATATRLEGEDPTDTSEFSVGIALETSEQQFDFGDAPEPYPTSLPDGARHVVDDEGPYLGRTRPDVEPNGQPNSQALGDDQADVDDEDGLWQIGNTYGKHVGILAGQDFKAAVKVHGEGLLSAFIDWNQDGDWNDAGEQIATDRAFATNSYGKMLWVMGTAPGDAVTGETFLRLRVSSQSGLGPTGEAVDGEVEDHVVKVVAAKHTEGSKSRFSKLKKRVSKRLAFFKSHFKARSFSNGKFFKAQHHFSAKKPKSLHSSHAESHDTSKSETAKFKTPHKTHSKSLSLLKKSLQKFRKHNVLKTFKTTSMRYEHHQVKKVEKTHTSYESAQGKIVDQVYAKFGHATVSHTIKRYQANVWTRYYAAAGKSPWKRADKESRFADFTNYRQHLKHFGKSHQQMAADQVFGNHLETWFE